MTTKAKRQRIKKGYRIARYIIYRETIYRPVDHIWTFVGAFFGIALIGSVQQYLHNFEPFQELFLIGSFGATAVLVYGATNSPLAQPRNLVGGHLISAFTGVTIYLLFGDSMVHFLLAAIAVSLSIILMQITKTMHPPGGATALIAVIGGEKIHELGYWYILSPVFSGVLILLVVALIVNNLPANRNYPYKRK